MHRFFVPAGQIPSVTGPDAHQIRDVLRMKPGESLELLDGTGKIFEARIISLEKQKIETEIVASRSDDSEPTVKVTLAQALPKARKMDLIVEKCVELGVNAVIPMLSERAVAKAAKPERWQRIAKEAAEQAKRAIIPQIAPLTKFGDVLKLKAKFYLALIAYELERTKTLKQVLSDPLIPGYSDILLTIGPEGGFSEAEVAAALRAGFTAVSLGKRILRAETAGLAALASIMYELG